MDRKEYMKKYKENNKEKIKENRKKYDEENKEKIKERKKIYYQNNREKIYKSDAGVKTRRIGNWKIRGVITDDFDSLYEYYINCKNCEECNCQLVEGNKGCNKKCLDHDHDTGQFRNVICHKCNLNRK